jgi:hypothetical protein
LFKRTIRTNKSNPPNTNYFFILFNANAQINLDSEFKQVIYSAKSRANLSLGAANANFSQQVRWELNALDKADYIIMYLDPNTISPISLLELGLLSHCRKMMCLFLL